MHPVLFKFGSFTIYSYGFCIALGALAGFFYMARQAKIQFGLSFDKSNSLFLLLVSGGVIGGKLFTIFEDPTYYLSHPAELFSGSGFVFYGSLLTCIPIMLWFFKRNKIPTWAMLDVMSVTTCILHFLGRIGCFLAGCCYGKPTESIFGVIFTNPVCQAEPLNTPLFPTQLFEAALILSLLIGLLLLKGKRKFEGQLFLVYLITYASGRAALEIFRGDLNRGFVIEGILSNSQFISLLLIGLALLLYVKRRNANLLSHKPLTMENENFGQKVKRKTKSFMKKLLVVLLILGIAVFSFVYWATYENGIMAGKVLRISEKGMIFKTFEGKLNLETFGALKGASPIAESFDFSVEKSEEEVIKTLQEVALSGERVNLKFKKRYVAFFWRGETKYFVTEVERLK